jgi:dTDP-glucose 4,6-dehydratase
MITNALDGVPLPVYGDGRQVRDWLHVDDHCRAIWAVLQTGKTGCIYNISADEPLANIDIVKRIVAILGADESLIRHVTDRPGHDRRYAITSETIRRETNWAPHHSFEEGLSETVAWYRANQEWVRRVRSGGYTEYYDRNYGRRAEDAQSGATGDRTGARSR